MLQITRTGLTIDAEEIPRLREQFSSRHCIVLPSFIEAGQARQLVGQVERADFMPQVHKTGEREFARDLTIDGSAAALHFFHMLLNNRKLFAVIQEITGCPAIGNFSGRIYRNLPGSDHHLDWHDDDVGTDRLIGISVNLSTEPYSGGVFQLRYKGTKEYLCAAAHQEPGSAHLFRIASNLEHRLTPVTGTVGRTAGTGWFMGGADKTGMLKKLAAAPPGRADATEETTG